MKQYQKTWVKKLKESTTIEEVIEVCEDIVGDDTGTTDELSQTLAKIILEE